MGRSWSNFGFNPAGKAILDEKVKVGKRFIVTTYTDGRIPTSHVAEEDVFEPAFSVSVYDDIEMWYDEKLALRIYTFKDGRVLEDYIQAEPWSSGPCTFLALRDHLIKEPIVETLWDQSEIDSV